MQAFTIKYYSRDSCPPISSFYILSRGHNTGRPSYSPNANSFIFSCASQDFQKYYWLVYALWYGRKFEDYLCGSVIEFIRVDDLKNVVAKASQKMENIDSAIATLQKLLVLETKLKKQIDLIQIGQRSILQAI